MLVLDSSVLIAHLRGRTRTTRFLRQHGSHDTLVAPALAAWELWKGATTPARAESVHALLEAVQTDPFVPAMAHLAGRLHVHHRAAGMERPAYDLLIASHALYHHAPLATLDRDYDGIDGLDIVRAPS